MKQIVLMVKLQISLYIVKIKVIIVADIQIVILTNFSIQQHILAKLYMDGIIFF